MRRHLACRLIAGLAIAVGVTVAASSGAPAAGLGQFCGGVLGIHCDAGLFCDFPGGTCGRFDQGGKCAARPRFCPLIFRPVCGCNGKTYSNDCVRERAGVSRAHNGRR